MSGPASADRERARAIVLHFGADGTGAPHVLESLIAAALEAAREEERERCARIAEGFVEQTDGVPLDTGVMWRSGQAQAIARALRAAAGEEGRG